MPAFPAGKRRQSREYSSGRPQTQGAFVEHRVMPPTCRNKAFDRRPLAARRPASAPGSLLDRRDFAKPDNAAAFSPILATPIGSVQLE
jgi:hypothetical protein